MSDFSEPSAEEEVFDMIVAGSGAGGLSAALTGALEGLNVLVIESSPLIGGTTARSGGVVWIPANGVSKRAGVEDSADAARQYIQALAGEAFDPVRTDAFLNHGPEMLEFFESRSQISFVPQPAFPDYHPNILGSLEGGRSIVAASFDGRKLGPDIHKLRPPLREITFVGMMFNASQEVQHFFRATRSLKSAAYVVKRLLTHGWEMLRFGRAMRLTNGNALAARLFVSARDQGVEFRTNCGVASLIRDDAGVSGVITEGGKHLRARFGVILATGGFPRDPKRQSGLFPHVSSGQPHLSPAPESNQGTGLRAAEAAGAAFDAALANPAAWIPVSRVPMRGRPDGVFPHLIDRYKPGVIAVDPWGRRFVNEAESYHVVGQAMLEKCRKDGAVYAWLLADHRALRRYGLGIVKPFPIPFFHHLRSGYLKRAASPKKLALAIGCQPSMLESTIARFNADAECGSDSEFGKGNGSYNRYLGDPNHEPNACLAPLLNGPFYAIKLEVGDLGTFAGLKTDGAARVLDLKGQHVPGLYACGNDMASVMGGAYPGGGITLGPAMTFGYIASCDIAAQARLVK